MNAASVVVDVVAALCALAVIARRIACYSRVRIDHVLLFSIGHLYYMSLGSLLAHVQFMPVFYDTIYRFFDQVTPSRRLAGSVWSLAVLVAFLVGSSAGHARQLRTTRQRRPQPNGAEALAPAIAIAVTATAMFLAVCVVYRSTIIAGYSSADPELIREQTGRGVVAATAVLVSTSVLYLREIARRARVKMLPADIAAAFGVAIPALVLLVSGGRMYVATFLTAFLVWLTHVRRPARRTRLAAGATLAFVLLTALGALRIGTLPTAQSSGFYATSESVLTTVSYAKFLDSDRDVFSPLHVPTYLATDLVNVVPRAVLPNKDDIRADPEDDGYTINSSLGAVHFGVSALINFGYLGSLFVLAALGYALSRLERRVLAMSGAVAVIAYSTISAALVFSLYRDPFSISVVRWMVFTGLLTPLACAAAVRVVHRRPLRRDVGSTSLEAALSAR